MPIRKFRTIEEAVSPVLKPLDGKHLRSAIELSELCHRLHPKAPPRGVLRFVSIEDADEHRRGWELRG